MNKLLTLETLTMDTSFKPTVISSCIEACIEPIAALETEKERDDAYSEFLMKLIDSCRDRFVRVTTDEGIRPGDLHDVYGIDYSILTNVFAGKKTLPTYIMADVCDRYFHVSANELVYGLPSLIVIPNECNAVIRLAEEEHTPGFQEFLRDVLKRYKEMIPQVHSEDPIPPELVHERLRSISRETGLSLVKAGNLMDWSHILARKQPVRPDFFTGPVPALKRLVGYSIRWRLPIDYFIARDYTKRSQLYYRTGRTLHLLTNGLYISLVSVYLRLSQENREHMISELLDAIIAA